MADKAVVDEATGNSATVREEVPIDDNGDPDLVVTLGDGPEVEECVKSSRFIAQVFAAENETIAMERLHAIRARYPDATHHCFAYRIGSTSANHDGPGELLRMRADDAGEPGRTAGLPILQAIESAGFTDVLTVVTRYFGGVKLGKGGLVRAYGGAARAAIAAAPRTSRYRRACLRVQCSYDDLGTIEGVLAKAGEAIIDVSRQFENAPRFDVTIRESRADSVAQAALDATHGRAKTERIG